MVWTGHETGMNVKDWGWKLMSGKLVPIITIKQPAPGTLL